MTEIKRSIKIEAPVGKVFDYASDYLNWPKFFKGVSDFKPITGKTRGGDTKITYKAKMMGMNITLGTELQEFKVNEGWIGKSFKGLEHKTQWIFKESNGNTEFTYILSYKFPMGRFLDKKLMQPTWIKIIENSLENLKRLMEEK